MTVTEWSLLNIHVLITRLGITSRLHPSPISYCVQMTINYTIPYCCFFSTHKQPKCLKSSRRNKNSLKEKFSQVYWYKDRQISEFLARQVYRANSRTVRATQITQPSPEKQALNVLTPLCSFLRLPCSTQVSSLLVCDDLIFFPVVSCEKGQAGGCKCPRPRRRPEMKQILSTDPH